ncbi:hypothetical protein [Pelagicoccus sp. SDUM812003]|uniref:hypothetical protein n=1 Tax=Pelagicoccus sp. SDUM812003 TaxID=3041267 RepID=UPI0028124BF3|nr:hypothetical protein [Pelagicoccus sp. SDUM812003]
MKKTRRTVEEIIRILRDADTELKTEDICRKRNISARATRAGEASMEAWKSRRLSVCGTSIRRTQS